MDGGIGVEKFVRYHLKAVIACHGFANQMLQNRSAGGLIGVVLYPFHNHSLREMLESLRFVIFMKRQALLARFCSNSRVQIAD